MAPGAPGIGSRVLGSAMRGQKRGGSSQMAEHAEGLERHLSELCDLFGLLLPDGGLGVGLYDETGQLIAGAGRGGLPVRHTPCDTDDPSAVTSEAGAAFGRVRATLVDPMTFAVHARPGTPDHTLISLCRMGASFLAGTLDRLSQTRRLQQLVREQEAIIDHISDGLLVLDRNGVLRYLNEPGGRILGLEPKKSVGRLFADVLDFEPIINPIFQSGRGYIDRELQIRTRRLDLHLVDTAVPIIGADGEVVSIVNTFREMSRVKRLSNRLTGDRSRYRFADILGHSQAIKDAIALGRRAARSDANVLLYGESGTGKEVFAQSIHNDGRRAGGPFVAVNCAALPRDLIESEIFGYAPGSFTGADKSGRPGRFELASGGTIFLDEISEMPLDVQVKLLRVLQERQVTRIGGSASIAVDVRIIAAANRDLRDLVARHAFREDLFYRLNVVRLDLPPLRARREDIPRLLDEYMRRTCAGLHRPVLVLHPRVVAAFEAYDWPGNVRQLQNMVERLVNIVDGDEVSDLPPGWFEEEGRAARPVAQVPYAGVVLSLDEAERMAVRTALEAMNLNITQAAAALGITRATLYAKMKKFGMATSTRLT